MENIEYNVIPEGVSSAAAFIGYYWDSQRSIAYSESEYIPVPIAIEAGMDVEEFIMNYDSVDNPFESFVSDILGNIQHLEPRFSKLVDEHFWELADSLQISHRNPEAIESYLASHPEIEAFLSESWPGLEKHFGKDVSVILEVMTYPGEESYDELVGWIQSTDGIEVGLDKLEAFEEEWLTEHLQKVGNVFNFDIEFK